MADFTPKRYACTRWPFLRLQKGIKFNAGFYTTKSQEENDVIEASDSFGIHIHPIMWKPKEVPTKPGAVEALIESEIESALAERQPRARKGAIGTKSGL